MATIDAAVPAQGEFADWLSRLHDFLLKAGKIAGLIGACCGFIYLLAFTTQTGIPFPLELNVLPTTLLIVGLTSLVASFIVIAGMLIPAMTVDDFDFTGGYFKAFDQPTAMGRHRLKRYLRCTWIPMALALAGLLLITGIIGKRWEVRVLGLLLTAVSAGWVFFTPRILGRFEDKRLPYFFATFGQIAMSALAYLLTIIVFGMMFPETGQWPSWLGGLVTLLVFSPIHALVSIPISKGGSGAILQPPYYKRETIPAMRVALFLAATWTISSVILPQMTSKVGGAALRVFHVGGGLPVQICLKSKPADSIAKRLGFGVDDCSLQLSMQLDIGDRFYVSLLGESPGEPVYFRQDDIRQKIYFKPASKK
jgi:hypothetical protein